MKWQKFYPFKDKDWNKCWYKVLCLNFENNDKLHSTSMWLQITCYLIAMLQQVTCNLNVTAHISFSSCLYNMSDESTKKQWYDKLEPSYLKSLNFRTS